MACIRSSARWSKAWMWSTPSRAAIRIKTRTFQAMPLRRSQSPKNNDGVQSLPTLALTKKRLNRVAFVLAQFARKSLLGLGVHAPVQCRRVFHHGEVPHVHAHLDRNRHVQPFHSLRLRHLYHGGAVGTEWGGEDHFQAGYVILDRDIAYQPQLDDIHPDLRVHHL